MQNQTSKGEANEVLPSKGVVNNSTYLNEDSNETIFTENCEGEKYRALSKVKIRFKDADSLLAGYVDLSQNDL